MAKSKNSIRKSILNKRKKITPLERMFASDRIADYVLSIDEVGEADSVLLYADYNNEVMTDKLAVRLMMLGKKVFMPKVSGDNMEFYRIFELDEMLPGSFGIREPIDISDLAYTYKTGDIIICPGVAFDNDGNRIGYGRGYYDRYLEEKSGLVKIGICFQQQIVENISADENDIRMDYIVSEE